MASSGEAASLLPTINGAAKYKSIILSVCSFILVTEFCERFAYYGLTGSLPIFFRKNLGMTSVLATELNSVFSCVTYITPLIGAWVADKFLGRYRSILFFSIWYFLGLLICTTASAPPFMSTGWFMIGLFGFISLGVGGIKPNVVVLGADQFDTTDPVQKEERDKFFNWFYWSINIGATFSTAFLTNLAVDGFEPYIPVEYGFFASFLIPAVAFAIAITIFYSGHKRYVQKPPQGSALSRFMRILVYAGTQSTKGRLVLSGGLIFAPAIVLTTISYFIEDPQTHLIIAMLGSALVVYGTVVLIVSGRDTNWVRAAAVENGGEYSMAEALEVAQVVRLSPYFGFLIIFWAVYSQQTMNFILQGCQMDLRINNSTQISSAMLSMFDSIVILVFVPIFNQFLYPAIESCGIKLTILRKMATGFVVAAVCMLIAGILENYRKTSEMIPGVSSNCADSSEFLPMSRISVWWQTPQYLLVGIAEILISIPSYDLFYSEVPESMRSVCQAMNLLTTTLGSVVAGGVNSIFSFWVTSNLNEGHLEYVFYILAGLVLLNLITFVVVSQGFEYHVPAKSKLDLVSGYSPALPRAARRHSETQ
ncbi:Proton-dependent Oligopeptide Transporter (POT) Family [Thraustotheca clavata]|uniref:Proton-dependent Oligopeptide Transporter (POT) Family n=1 Tax=Thraustotheca clavata TaxID=74557 RepID=A0A1W0A228_9STRA|nr:Proton-dependent Oligopeptide Transporter (POT) Family [Thraustotheca clavata]